MGLATTPRTWLAGEIVTAAELNAEVRDAIAGIQAAWATYTPAVTASTTNPTMGTTGLIQTGDYNRIGKTILGRFNITFGTGMTAGSGTYNISLPVPPVQNGANLGAAMIWDTSAGQLFTAVARLSGATAIISFSAVTNVNMTAAFPMIPAAGDQINLAFAYQAA